MLMMRKLLRTYLAGNKFLVGASLLAQTVENLTAVLEIWV